MPDLLKLFPDVNPSTGKYPENMDSDILKFLMGIGLIYCVTSSATIIIGDLQGRNMVGFLILTGVVLLILIVGVVAWVKIYGDKNNSSKEESSEEEEISEEDRDEEQE